MCEKPKWKGYVIIGIISECKIGYYSSFEADEDQFIIYLK